MGGAAQLRDCADAIEQACAGLTAGTPASLDGSCGVLEAASRTLAAALPGLADMAATADALAEAWRLRRAVRLAGALLENASAYHRGWQDIVAAQTAGYQPGGMPAEIRRPGQVWIEG